MASATRDGKTNHCGGRSTSPLAVRRVACYTRSMAEVINHYTAPIGLPDEAHTVLLPGANEIADTLSQFVQTVPIVQSMVEAGWLEFTTLPERGLKALTPEAVAEKVATVTDRAELKRMLKTDARKSTRKALEDRAHELEPKNGD